MSDINKELRKKIVSMFRRFSMDPHTSPLKKQKDREIAGRFIDRLHTTHFDAGILPYHSINGLAKHCNKAECVFAMMCRTVLHYWGLLDIGSETNTYWLDLIDGDLKLLNTVFEQYDKLKVQGDSKGYYLIKSLPEAPDVSKKDSTKGEEGSPEETDEGIESTTAEKEQVDMGDILPDDGEMSLGEEQAMRGGGAL